MSGYARKTPELLELILKRYRGTGGNLWLAATSLGVSANTVRAWKKRDKEFRERITQVEREIKEEDR